MIGLGVILIVVILGVVVYATAKSYNSQDQKSDVEIPDSQKPEERDSDRKS